MYVYTYAYIYMCVYICLHAHMHEARVAQTFLAVLCSTARDAKATFYPQARCGRKDEGVTQAYCFANLVRNLEVTGACAEPTSESCLQADVDTQRPIWGLGFGVLSSWCFSSSEI